MAEADHHFSDISDVPIFFLHPSSAQVLLLTNGTLGFFEETLYLNRSIRLKFCRLKMVFHGFKSLFSVALRAPNIKKISFSIVPTSILLAS